MPILLAIPAAVLGDTLAIIGWTGFFTGTIVNCATRHCRRDQVFDLSNVPRAEVTIESADQIRAKYADVGPCNIPMYNFDMCRDQLHSQGRPVVGSTPSQGVARFDDIPPACMNLASALAGSCTGEGIRPTPCGSACMEYTGLSSEQMANLARVLIDGR